MLNSKILFWFLGVIIFILIIFLPGYSKLQELKDRKENIEAKISEAQLENARLEEEISRIQKDPVYQEEIVRDKLGVVRKGEVIYRLEPGE